MGAKPQKIEKVKELTTRFQGASGAMFADFRGLTVKDAMELRRSLKASETTLLVTKNTLTRIAVKEAGLDEEVLGLLEGPTAIAFINGDPVVGAKALVDSTKRFPALIVKGAVVEGRVLLQDQATALATLDTKEVSFGKIAGILQAPLQRLAYLLQAPLQRIAFALGERGKQAEPEAPAAEATEPEPTPAPIEEPAAEAAPADDGAVEAAPVEEPAAEAASPEEPTEAPTEEPAADAAPAEEPPAAEAAPESGPDAEAPSEHSTTTDETNETSGEE